jgi:hypothetical protein
MTENNFNPSSMEAERAKANNPDAAMFTITTRTHNMAVRNGLTDFENEYRAGPNAVVPLAQHIRSSHVDETIHSVEPTDD